MGVNKVILLGHAGRDAEVKTLQSGTHVANFTLATSDRRDKDENGQPRTEWHNIVAWGKLADMCGEWVTKGKQLYLEGQIRTRSYQTPEGENRRFTEIHAWSIELLGGRQSRRTEGQAPASPSPPPYDEFDDQDDVPF